MIKATCTFINMTETFDVLVFTDSDTVPSTTVQMAVRRRPGSQLQMAPCLQAQ